MEAHALAGRGWSISAIARHLGRDRKTVRAYVRGARSPGFIGTILTVRHRLGGATLEIVSGSGALMAVHGLASRGIARLPEHRAALERTVLGAFTTLPPCERKGNHPPGPMAWVAAERLRRPEEREVVVDLARYAELVETAR